MNVRVFSGLTALLAATALSAAELPKNEAPEVLPQYAVECPEGATAAEACQVSKETYIGWRTFHAHCFQCHGGSALGSSFAPNLVDRFNQHVDYGRFSYVMEHGYTGQMGAMPAFAKNPAVSKDVDALYAYLRARADGELPPGRPVRKKD